MMLSRLFMCAFAMLLVFQANVADAQEPNPPDLIVVTGQGTNPPVSVRPGCIDIDATLSGFEPGVVLVVVINFPNGSTSTTKIGPGPATCPVDPGTGKPLPPPHQCGACIPFSGGGTGGGVITVYVDGHLAGGTSVPVDFP